MMPNIIHQLSIYAGVLSFAIGVSVSAQTTSPKLLPFQGRLTDQSGNMVTNGTRLVLFQFYNAPVNGELKWAGELHRTTVNGGMVNVQLGTGTPLNTVDFDQALYLQITIDINGDGQITEADPPMLPRQMILPAVFAKESANSRKLSGWDWGALLSSNDPINGKLSGSKIIDNTLLGIKIALGSIGSSQIAASAINTTNVSDGAINYAKLVKDVQNALVPPGTIVAFAGPADKIPDGWLLCDGNNIGRTDPKYQALFKAIGLTWGYLSDADYLLPDLRGMFLRGVDAASVSRDPDRDKRQSYQKNSSASGVGSYQDSEFNRHLHRWSGSYINASKSLSSGIGVLSSGQDAIGGPSSTDAIGNAYKPNDGEGSIRPIGGNETRPKNVYVNYIIKY